MPTELQGVVIKSTGSWYKIMDKGGQIHDCRLRGKFKKDGLRSTNPVAVGDKVIFELESEQETGIITQLLDRKNHIVRKATNLSRKSHVIAANLDQALLIATLYLPRTSTGFIDRFLVNCEAYSVPAHIIFNKCDLFDQEDEAYLDEIIAIYEPLGYKCLKVSATEKNNLEAFQMLLQDKTTLLSGHSGVGKSTLINAIEPDIHLKTAALSRAHLKGKHTTTFAEMFQLSVGGFIIDTPGIKEFGLVDFEQWELSHYFPEMRKLFNACKFDNCTHYQEPGCAVREQVDKGQINASRYYNYLNMLSGQETRYKR